MGVADCLKSTLVYYCNETINVWSHGLAFLYFFIKFVHYFTTSHHSITDPFQWPLITYMIGIQGFCLMSSLAHTFNSISPRARNVCFSLDYAAISIYSVGAGQAFFFYSRPVDPVNEAFQHSTLFSVISVLVSIGSTVKCCLTRQKWHSLKYLLRTMSYVMPFLWNTSPYLYRMLTGAQGVDAVRPTVTWFYFHAALYIIAALANVSRLPERCVPGIFCVVGQSHHWMHVFTAIGAAIQLEGVCMDMDNRRHVLQVQTDQSYSSHSLVYMAVAVIVNFAVAGWFGCTTPVDRYKKNGAATGAAGCGKEGKDDGKKHD